MAGIVALGVGMLAEFLVPGVDRVLGSARQDMGNVFVHWKTFAFEELASGNLALWNPYTYSGSPGLGSFHPALLYPANLLLLILPLPRGINSFIALHLCLLGVFTYLWISFRGHRPLACFTAGSLVMFGGPYFWRLWAGHIDMIGAFPWVPLLLLATDGLVRTPGLSWAMVWMLSGAMMVLAGYPQTLLMAATAAALYGGLTLRELYGSGAHSKRRDSDPHLHLGGASQPWKVRLYSLALWSAVAGVGVLALSSLQLFTSLQEIACSTRDQGLPWRLARTSSLPPEAMLTWLVPHFFGRLSEGTYWGRCHAWEASLFVGVTGLALAIIGALGEIRSRRFGVLGAAVGMLLLALGCHTPLGHTAYSLLPGFSSMRGWGKFAFPSTLFIAALAARGLEDLQGRTGPPRVWLPCWIGGSLLMCLLGFAVSTASAEPVESWWHRSLDWVHTSGVELLDVVVPEGLIEDPRFLERTARQMARGLWVSSATMGLLGVLGTLLGRWRLAPQVIVALALLEVISFARPLRPSFPLSEVTHSSVDDVLRQEGSKDGRILQITFANEAIGRSRHDIWGHQPVGVRRYVEFMAFTQGVRPEEASSEMAVTRGHPLHSLLRLEHVLAPPDGKVIWKNPRPILPRLLLVGRHAVVTDRDEAFRAMSSSAFDPEEVVLLEEEPVPAPSTRGTSGVIRLLDESTDHLTLEADLPGPAILVVTDSYHPFWTARALPGSSHKSYCVLPANRILRGVPLGEGHHHFRLEYRPPGFTFLCVLFGAAWTLFLLASGRLLFRRSD